MAKDDLAFDQNIISHYFNKFKFTSVKATSITELVNLVKLNGAGNYYKDDYEIRREGLIGKWTILTVSNEKAKIELEHLIIGKDNLLFEGSNNYYKSGTLEMVGDRNLILTMKNPGRYTSIICNLNHYRKTHQIKYLACSYCATGSNLPIFGFSLMVRTTELSADLPVGFYDRENLKELGVPPNKQLFICSRYP